MTELRLLSEITGYLLSVDDVTRYLVRFVKGYLAERYALRLSMEQLIAAGPEALHEEDRERFWSCAHSAGLLKYASTRRFSFARNGYIPTAKLYELTGMPSKNLDYVPWYVNDYNQDQMVKGLSPIEDLVYRRLLEAQWLSHGKGLLNNMQTLSSLAGWNEQMAASWRAADDVKNGRRPRSKKARFQDVWAQICHMFDQSAASQGKEYVRNSRMHEEWTKSYDAALRRSERASKGGKAGGKGRPKEQAQDKLQANSEPRAYLSVAKDKTHPPIPPSRDFSQASTDCDAVWEALFRAPFSFRDPEKVKACIATGMSGNDLVAWAKWLKLNGRLAALGLMSEFRNPELVPPEMLPQPKGESNRSNDVGGTW